MNQSINKIIFTSLGIFLSILTFLNTYQISTKSINEQTYNNYLQEEKAQRNLELLLGPDINFPFRPENHKKKKGSVTRIVPSTDQV